MIPTALTEGSKEGVSISRLDEAQWLLKAAQVGSQGRAHSCILCLILILNCAVDTFSPAFVLPPV